MNVSNTIDKKRRIKCDKTSARREIHIEKIPHSSVWCSEQTGTLLTSQSCLECWRPTKKMKIKICTAGTVIHLEDEHMYVDTIGGQHIHFITSHQYDVSTVLTLLLYKVIPCLLITSKFNHTEKNIVRCHRIWGILNSAMLPCLNAVHVCTNIENNPKVCLFKRSL